MFRRGKLRSLAVSGFFVALLLAAQFGNAHKAFADFDTVTIILHPNSVTTQPISQFYSATDFHSPLECKIDDADFSPCGAVYTTPALTDGQHTFTVHIIGASNDGDTQSYNWTVNLPPTLSGGTAVSGLAGLPIAISDLSIDDSGNDTLPVKLTVPNGELSMSTITGLTFTGSQTGSTLEFSGSRTDLNSALATLTYTPIDSGSTSISATIEGINGDDYNTVDGRTFKLMKSDSEDGLTWSQAKEAAEASTYGCVHGYLANITSLHQNTVVDSMVPNESAWFGGNDIASEGDWRWSGGPEANAPFWSGDSSGSAVGGAFTSWEDTMPDNYNGIENCAEFYNSGGGIWNDQDCASAHQYYLVEYGDGLTIPYIDSKQVAVTVAVNDTDGDGIPGPTEAAAPNGGDANNDGTADAIQSNVTTQTNPTTNKYQVVQTTCAANKNVQVGNEPATGNDPGYDYPQGLVGYIATGCGAPGSSVTVTLYYYGQYDPSKFVLRKWDTSTGQYSTIPGVVLTNVTIGGQPVLKAVYQVVDGGPLDQDGSSDGNIRDPVGLAQAITAPDTGYGQTQTSQARVFIDYGFILPGLFIGFMVSRKYTQK